MLRKINQINHPHLPLLNEVRLLSRVEMGGRSRVSSGLYTPETIEALRPAVPAASVFEAQKVAREERRQMITDRLWAMYG